MNSYMKPDLYFIVDNYFPAFNRLFPKVTWQQFVDWIKEDYYGGWEDAGHTHAGGRRELKMLYATIRAVKPSNILEIGTYRGDSTNHILLAAEMNSKEGNACKVTTIDINEYRTEKLHSYPYDRLIGDSLSVLPGKFDFIFQDGNHTRKYVHHEVNNFARMSNLKTVFAHDCFLYPYIQKEYDMPEFWMVERFKEPAYQAGFLIALK